MRLLSPLSTTPFLLIFGVGTLLNGLFLRSPGLGLIFLIVLGLGAAKRLGNPFEGGLILLSSIMLFFTGAFYLVDIPRLFFAGAFLFFLFGLMLLRRTSVKRESERAPLLFYPLCLATAVLTALFFNAVAPFATELATRSPWLLLPPSILLYPFFIGILATITAFVADVRRGALPLILISAIGTLLAFTLFPLGYGFDPFIHEATIRHILTFGTIDPKPLYYIGQYALELFLVHLFALDLTLLNQLLLPVLAILTLPFALSAGLRGAGVKQGFALLSLVALPFGAFIMTTPQGLGYLFSAVILFLTLPALVREPLPVRHVTIALLALATLAIHPLAGIPIILYLALLYTRTRIPRLSALIVVATPLALPLVFTLQSALSGNAISIHLDRILPSIASLPFGFLTTHYDPILDLLYFFGANILPLLLLVSLSLLYTLRSHKDRSLLRTPLLFAFLLFLSSLLLRALSFDYLAEHERNDFAERLYVLMTLFLLPSLAVLFDSIRTRIRGPLHLTVFTLFVATLFTGNLYQSYPRHDGYARSGGFTISAYDLLTVSAIEEDANGAPYLVLANQAVSAVALREFGFNNRYYNNSFFYPIPTGGKLYERYLAMNESPTKENAKSAMDLLSIDRAYFVVNDYWWDKERIVEQAKLESDSWFAIGDEHLFVFLFTREEDSLESVR